ncbi:MULTISPECIES: PilN domain-containing protein [unclassified Comamonas]|uniref:PilN domain-containing protein n=1 Tax=Comamonas squillarum TaxID=2977320 RepID=A0ABY5ZVF9_9BURK|nr:MULTISPECIES: PilN domain-containing protein [unclassified Comamonas]PWB17974.1 fimbrial assembly protein [Comamonas sp. JNW]UXC16665.1 PilN domain-containing protein [Comamonas sp. PR12]
MAISTESRFFGLDLNQLKADVLKTWRRAPQWPPLSWLRPEQMLRLVPAEGAPTVVWESGQPVAKPGREPAFWAVELPEHMVLRKTVALPALDPQDCASAAELEVQAISPFAADDLLWGYTELSRSSKAVKLLVVLASRTQTEPYLQARVAEQLHLQTLKGQTKAESLEQPEVWVFAPERNPVVFQGFGEHARYAWGRKRLWWNVSGVALALLLLAAIAGTPTAQLRLRAIEATHAYEGMAAKTADVVAKRESLIQSADKVAGLSELLAERIDGVQVLSMLTKVLPDDTALQSARIQGSKVTISGLTENASALMQKLSNQDGVKDVRAPSAATRMGGGNKESFTIELGLDAKVFGPKTVLEAEAAAKQEPVQPAAAAPAAEGGSPAAPAPTSPAATAPGAPAASPGTDTRVQPKASVGGGKSGPTLGGTKSGPSLGGSKPSSPPPAAEQGGKNP